MDSERVVAEIAQVKEKIAKTETQIAEVKANIAEELDDKKLEYLRKLRVGLQDELIQLRKEKNLLMERLPTPHIDQSRPSSRKEGEIYPVDETHPEHINRVKHMLYQAKDDDESDAIVTVISATQAVASFHCFESYTKNDKTLKIHNVFEPSKEFDLRAVNYCSGPSCQVILFESVGGAKMIVEGECDPRINLPLWGREYYVLGIPGDSRIFHGHGKTHRLSYLSGSIMSVGYVRKEKAVLILGDSGSRPGFSGGPLINRLYGDLVGFCVGGGPNAQNLDEVCDQFEQARFMLATPSFHVKNWAHSEECFPTPDPSSSSDPDKSTSTDKSAEDGKSESNGNEVVTKQEKKRKFQSSDDESDEGKNAGTTNADFVEETEKEIVPEHLVPWRPLRQVLPPNTRCSALSFEDHRSYVAIIQNMLKATLKFRFDIDRKKIKAWDLELEEERKFYETTALCTLKSAREAKSTYFNDPGPEAFGILIDHERAKIARYLDFHAYQGAAREIAWPSDSLGETAPALNFRTVKVLQPGKAEKITIPEIHRKCQLVNRPIPLKNYVRDKFEKKVPISEDGVMQRLALENGVSVLMDASTLRHLLSAPWQYRSQHYACRVTVANEYRDGSSKKICQVCPPMLTSRVTRPSIVRPYLKWALWTTLSREQSSEGSSSPPVEKEKDETDELMEALGIDVNIAKRPSSDKRYAIVSFDELGPAGEEQPPHQVLVRTSVHGIESDTSRTLSLTVKPEFLPEIGAEKKTAEEVVWDFVTGLLKGSNEHVCLRVAFQPKHKRIDVLQIDRRESADLNRLDTEIRQLLSTRTQRMRGLIDALVALDPGEYLIVKGERDRLQILREKSVGNQQQPEEEESSADLYAMDAHPNSSGNSLTVGSARLGPVYDMARFDTFLKSKPIFPQNPFELWNGVDPHYPHQWHIVRGQIPGALYPKKQNQLEETKELGEQPTSSFKSSSVQKTSKRPKT